MSDRTHSPNVPHAPRARFRLLSVLTGTVILLLAAWVGLQVFRAHPAVSQTDDPDVGRANLNGNPNSRILARVNNQTITYDVVARECVARHGEEVLDSLVNRLIIQQECERRGIQVTQAEIEQEVANTAKKFKLPLDTWYKMLQAERGLNREQYHQDVIWPMMALKKLAGQQIQVTDEDLQNGFERNYGPRVKARMILVDGNVRQAGEIWEQCRANPDDFERIAREKSADPNTRPLGGIIPPIQKHGASKSIEDAAFKLQPGEISALIPINGVENRYVIIKCEGFTEPVVTDIRQVYDDLYAQLVEEKTQQAVAAVFEQIKNQARVDNLLTRTSNAGHASIQQASGVRPAGAAQAVQPATGARK